MLISSLRLLLRFGGSSVIYEEVSQTTFSVIGDNTTLVVSDSGYLMQTDQYLLGDGVADSGFRLNLTDALTVGFWWYPLRSGLAVNEDTGLWSSIEMPILDIVDVGSAMDSVFKITEHTLESGENRIKVSQKDDDYTVYSESYEISKWHFFWITHTTDGLKIYIDGKESSLVDASGAFEPAINTSLAILYINHNIKGYSWNSSKNEGIIDDIAIFNVAKSSETDIQRVINDGIEFVADDNYTDLVVDKYDVYFNDPNTITITSLVDDMSYIFLGRNDGKIMRGSPLFWETRRTFSDGEEYKTGGISSSFRETDANGNYTGFISLNNNTVRL